MADVDANTGVGAGAAAAPMPKRARHDGPRGSRIFVPYRAAGLVTSHAPALLQVRGAEHFVSTSVGAAFHMYSCDRLRLLFVSSPQPRPITCLAAHGDVTFSAGGSRIYLWRRGKLQDILQAPPRPAADDSSDYASGDGDGGGGDGDGDNDDNEHISLLLCIGDLVLSMTQSGVLRAWALSTKALCAELEFDPHHFRVSCWMHPATYLNKVLLGSAQGPLRLVNIRTGRVVHEFAGFGSAVTALVQAPAVDVCAVGLASGRIVLHHLRADRTIMTFQQDWGPVTALSFRTDGDPVLASAGTEGHVAIWDLEKRQLRTILRDAHSSSICTVAFLVSQPLLLTSGADNALKVVRGTRHSGACEWPASTCRPHMLTRHHALAQIWIFDSSDGAGRVLRARCGHSAPPTRIRYYDQSGRRILSAGLDRAFFVVDVFADERCRELSQGTAGAAGGTAAGVVAGGGGGDDDLTRGCCAGRQARL